MSEYDKVFTIYMLVTTLLWVVIGVDTYRKDKNSKHWRKRR